MLFLGPSAAGYLDDPAAFDLAVSALRSKIGEHARVLKIEIDRDGVAIEAQDPANRNHIDRWRYGTVVRFNAIPLKGLSGPQPVDRTLINPDLEANLFDLASVDLSAAPKTAVAAIARARLQDPAAVTRIEIQRQTFILPQPSSGDVRWTISVDSGRERAQVYANARGTITGADLSGTQRSRSLDILKDASLAADAAAAFRQEVGREAVLTQINIAPKTVSFSTNIKDQGMARIGFNLPATATYTWDLNGLQRRLGSFNVAAATGNSGPAPFSIDDVDWTIVEKLLRAALEKAAVANARIAEVSVAKSSEQPGGPVLAWTVEIMEPSGERTKVIADAKGAIQRVVLPEGRRAKLNWLDAASIAGVIARIEPTFGKDVKIASIVFSDTGARITVDDAANGGRPASFDFAAEGVTRSSISFSMEPMGPRFAMRELASLDEQKLAALQREALNRLAGNKPAFLESVTFGAHPFVRKAGARAIEIRFRDREIDSVQSHYAWMVFDFDGRPLDSSKF